MNARKGSGGRRGSFGHARKVWGNDGIMEAAASPALLLWASRDLFVGSCDESLGRWLFPHNCQVGCLGLVWPERTIRGKGKRIMEQWRQWSFSPLSS